MTMENMKQAVIPGIFPLRRPVTLAACAEIGARRYRRERDLPGAVPGLLSGDPAAILPRLIDEEDRCEQARRERSAAYRPAQHVQILSALLAEAAACPALDLRRESAPKAPILLPEMMMTAPGRHAVRTAGAPARQAKASGSEALRLAT